MILKFVRHLASHKQQFNVEVDVMESPSIAKALEYLNQELLGDIEKTKDFCLQNTERNKLLKLRLLQDSQLLSKQLLTGQINTSWAKQVKEDLNALGVNLKTKDHGASEYIFARAAIEHPELLPELVNFVDRLTIYAVMPDSKLMSYADLTNLGFMASVAITLYAPQEIDSAIALFNALGQYRDGSYSERFSSGVLMALYQRWGKHPQVSQVLAHHLSSFICYPDSRWASKSSQINIYDALDVDMLIRQYKDAMKAWCFDFQISDPEHYMEQFIEPLFSEQADVERITSFYRPFEEAMLTTES